MNNLLRKYIYGVRVDEPVCMIEVADSNAVYYYHYDALGSVVALSDSVGDTIQTYEYSVYGQVAAEDPNFLANPYMFTGRRFDFETGLYYYRARYYNPYIGRFLQTDPVGYGAGMNLYAYCGNNPLVFVDPFGLISIAFADWDDDTLGGAFREAADDFDYSFNMRSPHEHISDTEWVITILEALKYYTQLEITDIYLFDHSLYDTDGSMWGLQFGGEELSWEDELEGFCNELERFTEPDTKIHFRHCFVAYTEDTDVIDAPLLRDLATWTNRTVTGATGMVYYIGNQRTYKPNYEPLPGGEDGPDHYVGMGK